MIIPAFTAREVQDSDHTYMIQLFYSKEGPSVSRPNIKEGNNEFSFTDTDGRGRARQRREPADHGFWVRGKVIQECGAVSVRTVALKFPAMIGGRYEAA